MRVIVFNATINNISVSYIVTVSHIGGGNQSTWRNYDMYVTDKTMFGPVVCRREHVLFTSYVFVCSQWCPTYIDYMSNMTDVLLEAGTTCPSRADGFTTSYWWGPCCSSFQYSVLCFLFCLLSSFVLCTQCYQFLWIVHS